MKAKNSTREKVFEPTKEFVKTWSETMLAKDSDNKN